MRTAMAAQLEGKPIPPDRNPNQWADRTKSQIQFGYDVYVEVEQWWAASGHERIKALAGDGGADGGRAG